MMMNSKTIADLLRRDAAFVQTAVIAVMFVMFAGLALTATFYDLLAIRH